MVERRALALQASILLRGEVSAVGEACVTARMGGGHLNVGTLDPSVDRMLLIRRAGPHRAVGSAARAVSWS